MGKAPDHPVLSDPSDVDEEYHTDGEEHHDDGTGLRRLGSSASAPELLDLLDAEFNRVGLGPIQPLEDESTTDDEAVLRNPKAVVSDTYEMLYYLSDGVYGSFNNIIFDHAQPHPVLLTLGTET